MIWVNSNSLDVSTPTPGIRLSDYIEEGIPHTVTYGYDASGNANMDMLNVTQNRLPLSVLYQASAYCGLISIALL
jgi:hypothetical protein